MGPRSSERGNACNARDQPYYRPMASMGPRSSERGNAFERCGGDHRPGELQWGRARLSAEIQQAIEHQPAEVALQWGRARLSAEIVVERREMVRRHPASMGPRSSERGNNLHIHEATPRYKMLQWGRARLSAEIRTRSIGPRGLAFASMGPRSSERGNSSAVLDPSPHDDRASMGPRSSERGNRIHRAARPGRSTCFNGAALV